MQSSSEEKHNEPAIGPARHDEFYIADQLSVFQVERKLFKVHRHFLVEHSPVFRDMFALPTKPSSAAEGDSDEHPIHLSGVTVLEFESLMKVFYRSQRPDFALSYAEWLAVLAIAHHFDLQCIHMRAVQNVRLPPTVADAVPLLGAAEKYGVDVSEIPEALRMVVQRDATLNSHEMETLSITLVSEIVEAREKWIRSKDNHRCKRCGHNLQANRFRCNDCEYTTTNPSDDPSSESLLKGILKDVWDI